MKKVSIVLTFALAGWALCGAVMGIGIPTLGLAKALVVHVIAAPVIFSLISSLYFWKFAHTKPLQTAFVFMVVVTATDFLLVGLLIQKSLAMFESLIGTWIPFGLIFLSTYLTGKIIEKLRGIG